MNSEYALVFLFLKLFNFSNLEKLLFFLSMLRLINEFLCLIKYKSVALCY